MTRIVDTPWKEDSLFRRFSRKLVPIMFLLMMVAGMSLVLTSNQAQAVDISQCENMYLLGDRLGEGDDEKGNFRKKAENKSAKNIEIDNIPGRKISDLEKGADDLKEKHDTKNACIIIEAGSTQLKGDREDMIDQINRVADKFPDAKHIFWVKPVTKSGSSESTMSAAIDQVDNERDNFYGIDISRLRDNPALFEDNGLLMTDKGYETRVDEIFRQIENAGKDQDDLDDNQNNSGAGNNSGSNNGAGAGSGAGAGAGSQNGAGQNTSRGNVEQSHSPVGAADGSTEHANGSGTDADDGSDPGICGTDKDDNPIMCDRGTYAGSPANYADKAHNSSSLTTIATDYLPSARWVNHHVSVAQFNVDDLLSLFNQAPKAAGAILNMASVIASAIIGLTSMVYSTIIATGILAGADALFGFVTGSILSFENSTAAKTSAIVASILTISIGMSAMQVLKPSSGVSLKQGLKQAGMSVLKTVLVVFFVAFMGMQSRNNSWKTGQVEGGDVGEMIAQSIAGDEDIEGEALKIHQVQNNEYQSNNVMFDMAPNTRLDIASPLTWNALSLGWFVSIVFWFSRVIVSAFTTIATELLVAPFNGIAHYANNITNNDKPSTCDRYIDGLRDVFFSSAAARNNQAAAGVLGIIDQIFLWLSKGAYSIAYGGGTRSSDNSWCWRAEADAGRTAGDRLMVARQAGLYTDIAGLGPLIGEGIVSGSLKANGEKINQDKNMNHDTRGGLLVQKDGLWIPGASMEERARASLGEDATGIGYGQSVAYYAACVWEPENGYNATLSNEWRGTMAMGLTGNYGKADEILEGRNAPVFAPNESTGMAGKDVEDEGATSDDEKEEGDDDSEKQKEKDKKDDVNDNRKTDDKDDNQREEYGMTEEEAKSMTEQNAEKTKDSAKKCAEGSGSDCVDAATGAIDTATSAGDEAAFGKHENQSRGSGEYEMYQGPGETLENDGKYVQLINTGDISPNQLNMKGAGDGQWPEKAFLLSDIDCANAFIFEIGEGGMGATDREQMGFGKNIWSDRWSFIPLSQSVVKTMMGKVGNFLNDIPGVGHVMRGAKKVKGWVTPDADPGEPGSAEREPQTRFSSTAVTNSGIKDPMEFYYSYYGSDLTTFVSAFGNILAIVAVSILVVAFAIFPIALFNLVLSVVVGLSGFVSMFSLIMYALRGGRKK